MGSVLRYGSRVVDRKYPCYDSVLIGTDFWDLLGNHWQDDGWPDRLAAGHIQASRRASGARWVDGWSISEVG